MIKENQRLFNRLNVLSDGCLVFCALLLAYWVRFCALSGTASFPFRSYVYLALGTTVLCLVTYATAGLYGSYRAVRFHKEAQALFLATALDTLLLMAFLFVFRLSEMSRWMLVFFCVLNFGLLVSKRAVLRLTLRHYRKLGYNQKHVILVGDSNVAAVYVSKVREDKSLGYLVDGYVAGTGHLKDLPYLGDYEQLEAVVDRLKPDEVVAAVGSGEQDLIGKVIQICEKTGTKVSLLPYYAAYIDRKSVV